MSNGRIAGKIALITGGARGQGRQEAERFAAEGATVYITDVLDDVGAAAADELGDAVTFLHHDVTSEDD
ncbi:MAG: SDR family NAD(P)-dependent oxidoreductase, partial [Ilumatobacter sp.]|nr:SDR family NAD(P)-dependent oxidoreductase [Ilumatobacter sp.]